jgi:hypothetical protein
MGVRVSRWILVSERLPLFVSNKRDQAKLVDTYHIGPHGRSERRPHGGEDKKDHERLLDVHHHGDNCLL